MKTIPKKTVPKKAQPKAGPTGLEKSEETKAPETKNSETANEDTPAPAPEPNDENSLQGENTETNSSQGDKLPGNESALPETSLSDSDLDKIQENSKKQKPEETKEPLEKKPDAPIVPEVVENTTLYLVKRSFKDAPQYRSSFSTAVQWQVGDNVSHFEGKRLKDLLKREFVEVKTQE